jgi:hypothetical protein
MSTIAEIIDTLENKVLKNFLEKNEDFRTRKSRFKKRINKVCNHNTNNQERLRH